MLLTHPQRDDHSGGGDALVGAGGALQGKDGRLNFPPKPNRSAVAVRLVNDLEEGFLRRRVPLRRYGARVPKRPQQLLLDCRVRRVPAAEVGL